MKMMYRVLTLVCALATGATVAAGEVSIEEWTVPWDQSQPRDPAVAPDGSIWFVGQRADYVGHFHPQTEAFEKFDLAAGTGPHNVIVAANGAIWYTGNRAAHLGRLEPANGAVHQVAMPNDRARDPHTLIEAPDGDLWFTVQGGNFIGHMNRETEAVSLIDVPVAGSRPYGIVVTPDGRPWATLFGTHELATLDPETLALTRVALPRADARPRRLARTSDGLIWYVDYRQGYLGRYNPADGSFQEWRSPGGGDSRPYGMTADDQDRIWYVETGPEPNLFVGFDPTDETFSTTAIPSGAGAVRHMVFDPKRNAVWFGTDANTLGRADLP